MNWESGTLPAPAHNTTHNSHWVITHSSLIPRCFSISLGTGLNLRLNLPQFKVVMVHNKRQGWLDNLKLWERKNHMKVVISLISRPPHSFVYTLTHSSGRVTRALPYIIRNRVKCRRPGNETISVSHLVPENVSVADSCLYSGFAPDCRQWKLNSFISDKYALSWRTNSTCGWSQSSWYWYRPSGMKCGWRGMHSGHGTGLGTWTKALKDQLRLSMGVLGSTSVEGCCHCLQHTQKLVIPSFPSMPTRPQK